MAIVPIRNLGGGGGSTMEYITSGLTINNNRVTIVSGGYCKKGSTCYVKMTLTSNYTFSSSGGTAITGMPTPSTDKTFSGGKAGVWNNSGVGVLSLLGVSSGETVTINDSYTI